MQAPKGGVTIAGVFYKGGQFLPSDYQPKHGKYNGKSSKKSPKVRKVRITPYEFAEAPEGKRSIYEWLGVLLQNMKGGKLTIVETNQNRLNYAGLTIEKANELAEKWNNGERWV